MNLPAKPLPVVGDAAPQSSEDAWQERRPTVLIVDDDPTARLALAAMMQPDDYRMVFATDAAEARERLPLIDPDVILCDLVMKEMCGDELIRWLRAHDRWNLVPVIAITRIDSSVVRTDLLLSGADIVVLKPCKGPELRAHVKAALRIRHRYESLAIGGAEMPDR
jgi:two-component system response regulator MprA